MRIIKYPKFEICTCGECGTVFLPEAGDTIEYRFLNLTEHIAYIRCPTCNVECELTKPDATEINVGDK